MARSKETFNKKEVRNKQAKKRKDKAKKRLEKKEQGKNTSFDDMLAYVDENGNLTDTPPDTTKKSEISAESIEVSVPKAELRDDAEEKLQQGKVTKFDDAKGYGFIQANNSRESFFVHMNDCEKQLQQGDKVEFETENGPKGLKAVNVKIIK